MAAKLENKYGRLKLSQKIMGDYKGQGAGGKRENGLG